MRLRAANVVIIGCYQMTPRMLAPGSGLSPGNAARVTSAECCKGAECKLGRRGLAKINSRKALLQRVGSPTACAPIV